MAKGVWLCERPQHQDRAGALPASKILVMQSAQNWHRQRESARDSSTTQLKSASIDG